MSQSLSNIILHIIFSTKNRVRFIKKSIEPDLTAYIIGIFRNHGCPSIIVKLMEDHLHAMVSLSRTVTAAEIVKTVKSVSSKWIKEKGPQFRAFHWQGGYGAFSVSPSQKMMVYQYIANQEKHHRTMSFEEEYRKLLERNGVEYDERYLWT